MTHTATLVERLREQAKSLRWLARDERPAYPGAHPQTLRAWAEQSDAAAAALAAQRERMCGTCRFYMLPKILTESTLVAVTNADDGGIGFTHQPEGYAKRGCFILGRDIPETVDGKPFGCACWRDHEGITHG